ncbi:hypothetical protein [Oxalicibacterium faecigallinarum]|uniref:Integrase catalytic domain-containing protein n=1 Tax=Oxalicibacterium faecigallinarum TaxID=573741 RepID=A0A8J3ANT5_9BURK|nr:hypothetical protein [Oxalicibacterium faecigallinarum]GGI17039.1 hypothetical protein GCM10008066_06970 [Oxalicibacterium faecigallinarum]
MPKNTHRMTRDELNVADWKYPDEGALEGIDKKRYFSRKHAINLYLDGASAEQIKDKAGIGGAQTYRLLKERCLAVHSDGEVWGWRALVPWERIRPYRRKHQVCIDKYGKGGAGALTTLFLTHPELRHRFDKRVLSAGRVTSLSHLKRGRINHWNWLLEELRTLGYEAKHAWPFNTHNRGYVSICQYIKRLLDQNPVEAALVVGGPDAKKKLMTGDGTKRPITHLFERVEMDGHKLDGIFSVLIPQPSGGYLQKIVHRLWVVVIIEVMSRNVIGYHLSMREEVSKVDVLRAIKMALTRYKRPIISFSDEGYRQNANLPSGVSEDFVGICWDQTSVDGALAETCKHVKEVLRDVVGSELIDPSSGYSARRSKDDRPFIETYFRRLSTYGFQKLSNTTGAEPKKKRGRDPKAVALTSQFQYEYAHELLAVLIANYNAQPHNSLGGRSPLEYLQFRAMYPERPFRYADQTTVSDLLSFRKLCTVHGGYKVGRRPFINFAHGRYTSDTLGQRHDLVGKKIWVVAHIEDDVRLVRASTENGQSLGLLHVAPPWNKLPHSIEVRNAVASYVSSGKIRASAGHDAVELFIQFCEDQKNKKLPVHPAYMEARRILTEVAESITGRSMLELAKERQSAQSLARNDLSGESSSPLERHAAGEKKRPLPAPRKAANH